MWFSTAFQTRCRSRDIDQIFSYTNQVTPQAALDMQIESYRRMSGEQRLAIALDLHELSCDIAREGIRAQHPDANEKEVERLLRRRLDLVTTSGQPELRKQTSHLLSPGPGIKISP